MKATTRIIFPQSHIIVPPAICDFGTILTLPEEAAVNGDFVSSSETRLFVRESNAEVERTDVIYGLEPASSLICLNSYERQGTQRMIYSDTNSVQGVSHNAIYSLQPD